MAGKSAVYSCHIGIFQPRQVRCLPIESTFSHFRISSSKPTYGKPHGVQTGNLIQMDCLFHYIRHHVSHILSTSCFMRRHEFIIVYQHVFSPSLVTKQRRFLMTNFIQEVFDLLPTLDQSLIDTGRRTAKAGASSPMNGI